MFAGAVYTKPLLTALPPGSGALQRRSSACCWLLKIWPWQAQLPETVDHLKGRATANRNAGVDVAENWNQLQRLVEQLQQAPSAQFGASREVRCTKPYIRPAHTVCSQLEGVKMVLLHLGSAAAAMIMQADLPGELSGERVVSM
jgi:hypothetical protein